MGCLGFGGVCGLSVGFGVSVCDLLFAVFFRCLLCGFGCVWW